jgi:hypothetical protein
MSVQRGQTVRLNKPTQTHSAGAEGVVFWVGKKPHWSEERCGFTTPSGKCWAATSAVSVIDAAIKAVKASGKKKGGGPRVFCKATVERVTHKAILANGTWWPKSQASFFEGWLCATEWIVKQKHDGVIPQCWLTKAGMEAKKAETVLVNDLPVNVADEVEDSWGQESHVEIAEKMGLQPPPGSFAATARMMAGPNPSNEEAAFWDAWKDEMKERGGPVLSEADKSITDVVIDLFED